MLKIKVGTHLHSGHGGDNCSHNSVLHQGMSEAKVEKIKVCVVVLHVCAPCTAHMFIGSGA